ncbi:hypothetical protein ACFW9I_35765 [[Kitasatospora] papulosa]|uniref:hypothetical protein n=1 Tax=[Kitasatospora] papulosa TaxID=1464011 RepID=UPI00367EEF02
MPKAQKDDIIFHWMNLYIHDHRAGGSLPLNMEDWVRGKGISKNTLRSCLSGKDRPYLFNDLSYDHQQYVKNVLNYRLSHLVILKQDPAPAPPQVYGQLHMAPGSYALVEDRFIPIMTPPVNGPGLMAAHHPVPQHSAPGYPAVGQHPYSARSPTAGQYLTPGPYAPAAVHPQYSYQHQQHPAQGGGGQGASSASQSR